MVRAGRRRTAKPADREPGQRLLYRGGAYRPLSDTDCERIINSGYQILERIGINGAPVWLRNLLIEHGAKQRDDGRLTFPQSLVEAALVRSSRTVAIPGSDPQMGIEVGTNAVHIGTGGAAVQVLESNSGKYRDSTLSDLYGMMRVLNSCDSVHYGVRPLVARDMQTSLDLDINTAYACMRATGKPVGISFDQAQNVEPVCKLFDCALGSDGSFRKQPFCMAIIVHVVPPLCFAVEGADIMRAAIEAGMPLQICSAGQAGATSPASLAGALAQGLAESLAGMIVVDALKPGHPCIYAFMPFISDLRTGAMTGGSGESAVANAAAAQLLNQLELPSTVSAGMTDSKSQDVQAGYEKAYSVSLAAHAGADMINLSVGMLGSIMVASPEALVIDNDMCAAILRSVRGIDVSDELLDLETIERVVSGEGHYLGEQQTLQLMKTEYLYPELGDRQSVPDWIDAGSPSIWDSACQQVKDILSQRPAGHIDDVADRKIRQHFDIKLTVDEL